ncbi:MAG: 30S ribosomal protein S17 [Candidatus Aenigmatarchaeota archaeon]
MVKNIGIEAKQPEKECNDVKCPWHGHLKLRGRVFVGEVVSDKAKKSVVVRWDYVNYIPKYERYERRNTKVMAYNPECINAKKGDVVKIAECRPLSKTKSFCVIEILKKGESK